MKRKAYKSAVLFFAALVIASSLTVQAQTFQLKANNNSTLDAGASWVSGTAPNSTSLAVWDATVSTAANCTNTQAAGVNWGGIAISNPAAPVYDNATGHSFNLQSLGINLVGQSLTLNTAELFVDANQTWTTANGNVLTVQSPIIVSNNLTVNGSLIFSNLFLITNGVTLWITNPATVIVEETNAPGSPAFQIGGGAMVIQTNGMVILGTGVASAATMTIGSDSTSGSYYLSGGTNTDNINGMFYGIGIGIDGQSGAGRCYIPNVAGGTGTMNVSGTGYFYSHVLRVGSQGTGIMNVTNGTVTGANEFDVGYLGVGTLNVYGGTVNANTGLYVGRATNGVSYVNLYGGAINVSADPLEVPNSGGGGATVNVNGGTLTLNDGVLLPEGGTNNGVLATTCNGTMNLNGGVTITTTVGVGSSSIDGYLNLNGGVLKPATTTAHFIASTNILTVNVEAGGAIIDTTNINIYIPAALLNGTGGGADGGLTKLGSATLTLTNVNTYNGGTTISNGTLALSNGSINNSTNISIASGATFDVSGLASPYNLSGSTSLSASGTGTTTGTSAATINGASGGTVNLGSRPVVLTYDGSHPAFYISQGTLSLNGNAFTVNSASPLAAGTYTIAQQASGNITSNGTFTVSGTAIASEYAAYISVVGGNVNLTIYQPVAAPMTVYRTAGLNLLIALSDIATNWTDAGGYPVSLTGVNLTTTNGQTLSLLNVTTNSGAFVINDTSFVGYTNGPNVNDQFSYSIVDSQGKTNIGLVNIVIVSSVSGQATGIVSPGGGAATVSFAGIPGDSYSVQRSTNLMTGSGWVTIWTTNAPAGGLFNYSDSFGDLGGVPSSAYYRLSW